MRCVISLLPLNQLRNFHKIMHERHAVGGVYNLVLSCVTHSVLKTWPTYELWRR
jgi:hypothetical protein